MALIVTIILSVTLAYLCSQLELGEVFENLYLYLPKLFMEQGEIKHFELITYEYVQNMCQPDADALNARNS